MPLGESGRAALVSPSKLAITRIPLARKPDPAGGSAWRASSSGRVGRLR
ncbi:MAG: hypothetical protein HC897_09955 [Thermoanaerobaculia bacterium]|nr:hypothetical protein [Thermoanaerobaculia bacterium]